MVTAAPEEKRAIVALAPMPAAPALWSPANMLPEATAPPYTADWMPAAMEPAATPVAVNPVTERTIGAPTTAATPPTKPAVADSFQHHPPLFESFKKEKLSLSNRKAHLVMGNRVQDFAESISVSSLRLLKLYVVKTGKAFNFKLNLGSGVLGGGETCDLNRIMFP